MKCMANKTYQVMHLIYLADVEDQIEENNRHSHQASLAKANTRYECDIKRNIHEDPYYFPVSPFFSSPQNYMLCQRLKAKISQQDEEKRGKQFIVKDEEEMAGIMDDDNCIDPNGFTDKIEVSCGELC